MSDKRVAVIGAGLFVPGFPDVPAWLGGVEDASRRDPKGTLIPPRERRRTSGLTRAFADVYGEALSASAVTPSLVASVFGSALGEASTMIGLLDQMWTGEGTLSPMRFVASVHNAAAGVVSIATANRGFTTSLGADFDTPAMALAEAIAIVLSRGEPVIVCCGDEGVPEDLVPVDAGWELLTAAVALCPVESAPAGSLRLGPVSMGDAATCGPCDAPRRVAENPNAGMLDLVDAIARGRMGTLRLDRGRGRGFTVTLSAS